MIRIFIGWDHRQPISYNVLQHSLGARSSAPVSITPLVLPTLPLKRTGLTPFTFSRFLVPWLCDYEGWAIFMDADMLVLGDIAELWAMRDSERAVQVVKNEKRFEWPSLMLWNCGHPVNQALTPHHVENENPFKWDWLGADGPGSDLIGSLPAEWNHLVGYDKPRTDAKLAHFTAGIPPYEETNMCEYSAEWAKEHELMNAAVPWVQLMGNSVHVAHLPDGRVLPHFHPDVVAAQAPAAV